MQKMPEVDESKENIRFAVIQTLIVTGLILIAIAIGSTYWIKSTKNNEINKIKADLIQSVDIARNSIEPDLELMRSGKLSYEEGLSAVVDRLSHMTYTDLYGQNYIFLVNYEGYIMVQPYQPWLVNTNQWEMKDINGLMLIQEILKIRDSADKKGFVTYMYKPPNLEDPEEKLSYIMDIPELKCVIGTGKYMRLYYEGQTRQIFNIALSTGLLACLVLFVSLIPLRRISKTSKKLEQEITKRGEAQLHMQESEANLRTVFNSISDALFIHRVNGEIIEVNDRVPEMFGSDRNRLIGEHIKTIANPEDYNEIRLRNLWEKVILGDTYTIQLKAIRLDTHEPFYVEAAMRHGSWYGEDVILAVVRDIQKRKFYEQEFIRNQLINEHAEQMALLGHYSIDLKTQEIKWSKGLYSLFGRDPSLPAPDFDEYYKMVHHDDVERIKKLRLEMYEKKQPYSVEYRIRRSDGDMRDVFVKVDWLGEDGDENWYLIGSIQDITDHKRAVLEISEREKKFRSTVQQMSDGLILIDQDGIITEWNSASERISELSYKSVIGKPLWKIFPLMEIESRNSLDIEKLQKDILRAVSTGKSSMFKKPLEIAIHTKSGKDRILLQSIFPIRTGSTFRLGIISRDVTEEKMALQKVSHELDKLACLRSIDASILERSTAESTLDMIASICIDHLDVDGVIITTQLGENRLCSVYRSDIDTDDEPVVANLKDLQLSVLEKFGKKKFDLDTIQQINGLEISGGAREIIRHKSILPLVVNKKPSGFIQLLSTNPHPEDQEWKDYFITLAGQTSLSIENVTLISNEEKAYNELLHAHEATIAGWSKALELRDEETKGHSDRVMYLACHLAKRAGLPREKMTSFRRGVLLHDIGKMGIPDRILLKPGPLTDEEWVIMRTHPVLAYELLSTIPYLHDSLEVPYCHHERWDGSGYPRGLSGEDIPLTARIFAIVDVWDALISDRPYRNGWEPEKIRQYLIDNKAVMFDPDLVDRFIDLIDQKLLGKEMEGDEDCWI